MKDSELTIFTVSDGTGETALNLVRAAKVQFENANVNIVRFGFVSTRDALEDILTLALTANATLVATLVNPDLRIFLISRSLQLGVRVVDVLFPLLDSMAVQLKMQPTAIPGLLRKVDEEYFKRVRAIEYTVRHDDGVACEDLADADLVLIGISRTSKTPLSMYLAHKGYKVANIPLVPGVDLPRELFQIDQRRIVGLIIDPQRLSGIRQERIKALGANHEGSYADVKCIQQELEWSLEIFKKNKKWPFFDVTQRALEETAVEIEKMLMSRIYSM